MALFVLTSVSRSPGVTTTSLGLALTSSEPVLLVDADRQPSQSVLAGFLQGADPHGRGLAGLLQAHRERRPMETCLEALTMPLGGADDVFRGFLPGFTHPGMVNLFAPAWPDFVAALAGFGGDVVLDGGRIGADGLPSAVVAQADGIAVLTRTGLGDLVALRLYLPQLLEEAGAERVGLVLVGDGRPYTAGEIRAQFGVEVWGSVAWSPAEASVLSDGVAPGRRFLSGPFVRSLGKLGGTLAGRTARVRQQVGAPR